MKIGTLSKLRRQRQRERHQTKVLTSKAMAMHVRYKSLNISYPFSSKQQREMTKFWYFGEREQQRLLFVFSVFF